VQEILMAYALCPRCGTSKKRAWAMCRNCGLDPADDEEALVKSVYLSVGRFDDGDDRRRYREELDELGARIRAGESPAFDEAELERLRKQKRLVESVPASAVWGAVFRLFLPVIIVVAVLVIIVILRRL
jgi:hypothetical protein